MNQKIESLVLVTFLLFAAGSASAVKLEDLASKYEVLFTNPVCQTYEYPNSFQVLSKSGNPVLQKPKGAYCGSKDQARTRGKPHVPETRLVEWINGALLGDEIFVASLSFTNSYIRQNLCEASKRGVKINFVMDRWTYYGEDFNKTEADTLDFKANDKCQPNFLGPETAQSLRAEVFLRGGSDFIRWGHNKLFIRIPGSDNEDQELRIAFGSGNQSSGVIMHHENWHFITVTQEAYFSQLHLCMRDTLLDPTTSYYLDEYANAIQGCREKALEKYEKESDMWVYLVPGEGEDALTMIRRSARAASKIFLAAHRYSFEEINEIFKRRLSDDQPEIDFRIVVDDDLYWIGEGEDLGNIPGSEDELELLLELVLKSAQGAQIKYMETNEWQWRLHHNKFLIFTMEPFDGSEDHPNQRNWKSAVFSGAGNFSEQAFRWNYENYYYTTIPYVVKSYTEQYLGGEGKRGLWNMATRYWNMPTTRIHSSQMIGKGDWD